MTILNIDEMILNEEIDLDALEIIRDNFDELYDSGKLGRFVDAKNGYTVIQDKKVIYDMLNNFLKTRKKTTLQKYKYANGIKWGRMFSDGLCLQGISRVIRQTISRNIYWDVDIQNCHPQILYKYCLDNKLQVPTLKKYIENRDELLKDLIGLVWNGNSKGIITRDEAKTFPLAIINGGKRSSLFDKDCKPEWIALLEHEVKDIFNFFKDTPIGKKFYKRAYDKKDNNIEGSSLNYYLCEQENKILCRMYEYLRSRGIRVGVFCFDGLMIYKNQNENEFAVKFLKGMEDDVKENLGYDLKILVKPMTEYLDISGYEKSPLIDTSDEGFAKYFFDNCDLAFHSKRKELYVYDEKIKLWRLTEKECLRSLMTPILMPYLDSIKDLDEKKEHQMNLKCSSKQTKILTSLWAIILGNAQDSFIDSNFDKKLGFFPIDEGKLINLRTLEIRDRNKLDYFTRTTTRHFKSNDVDEDFVRKYFKEILSTDDESYVDWILHVIGYCLSGENNMKQFYILLGEKDTGKSLFLKIITLIFESYGGVVNDRVFKASRSESVHNTEAFSLLDKRTAFVSEIEEDEKFNEQLIKKISGGDDINIRGCGSDRNVVVNFNCVLWLATNCIPKFNEEAFAQRMRVISFNKKFEKNSERRDEILDKIDDFFTLACMMAQKYYANKKSFDDIEQVLISTKSVLDERDTFQSWIVENNDYEIDIENFSGRMKKTDIYTNYLEWCNLNKVKGIGRNTFYKRFDLKYNLPTFDEGKYWRGIQLKKF